MATYSARTRPSQFRLPEWAALFVEERAVAAGSTKTEVVLEALECLRQRDVEQLMAEGYIERAEEDREFAELSWQAGVETWPEW